LPVASSALVSIVIPTRNYADYVGQAIRSALDQGYGPIELIVVDDGSTDATPSILERFDTAIRVVRLEGRGVSVARNAGLAKAGGDHVVFLDADDLLLPGGLAAQVARLERAPDVDVVAGEWYVCDVDAETIYRAGSALRDHDALSHLQRSNVVSTPSAMMLRRRVVDAVGGFDPRLSFTADWEMWLRLARHGYRFASITAPVAMYRLHGRSMTRNLDRAIDDSMKFLAHGFTDGSGAPVTVESPAEFRIMMYLARLCLQQLDEQRARDCLRRAVRRNPTVLDTVDLYDDLATALSHDGRPGGRDVPRETAMLLRLTADLDAEHSGPRAERQALRHLAAGLVARNGREWRPAVRHVGLAIRASRRTVLRWSLRRLLLRILVPIGPVLHVRRMVAAARALHSGGPDVPPIVRAALDTEKARCC
jgi:hypothetical protein